MALHNHGGRWGAATFLAILFIFQQALAAPAATRPNAAASSASAAVVNSTPASAAIAANGAPPAAAPVAGGAAPIAAPALQLEQLKLLALAPLDGRAVLLLPTKQMLVLKVGDTVPGTRAVLTQVLADKLVFEEAPQGAAGKQLVWMHKSPANQAAKVERFSALPPAARNQQPQQQIVISSTPIAAGAAGGGHPLSR